MSDPNNLHPDEEQASADETEISQSPAEKQLAAHNMSTTPGESAQELLTQPAAFIPRETASETMGMATAPQAASAYERFGEATGPAPYPGVIEPVRNAPAIAPVQYLPQNAYSQPGAPEIIFTQPGYPQYTSPLAPGQFQPGQPFMVTPPKRRKTGLWVALIIVAILLLGGGTAFAVVASQRPTNTPTQALQTFCHGYKTLNAQEVYGTLTRASQSATSVTQIQQSFDELRKLSSFIQITDCTVSNVQQKSATATGLITFTESVSFDGTSTPVAVPLSMALALENNTWKIDTSQMNSNLTGPNFPTPTVPGASNQ